MKTMKYLFGMMLLVMFSMTASADDQTPAEGEQATQGEQATTPEVAVSISEFTGGKVAVKDKKGQDVIITVTPDKDYYIEMIDLTVIAVRDPASATRGEETIPVGSALKLTLLDDKGNPVTDDKGEAVADPKDTTQPRDYKFTVPEGLGAWVSEANFHKSDQPATSGKLSDKVTWEVTGENQTKTLTISGDGKAELTPSKSVEATAPWSSYAADITNLVIDEGIETLGDDLLKGFTNLQTITLKGQKMVALGKNELKKEITVDVYGRLFNEYRKTDGWKAATITSTTGKAMKGVAFGENNIYDVFASKEALFVPSVLLAYTVTAIDGSNVKISEITDGIIPAGVPVLLMSKDTKDNVFMTAASDKEGDTKESLLKAAGEGGQKVALGEVYLLYNNVFYLSQAGMIPEGGVYLPKPKAAGTRSALVIGGDDGTTGVISQLSTLNPQLSDVWYSLDGRKLNAKPTAKGIYVNNGRKVVIR